MATIQRTSKKENYKMLQNMIRRRRRRQQQRQIHHHHHHYLLLLLSVIIILIMNDFYIPTSSSSPPIAFVMPFRIPTPHHHRHPFLTTTDVTAPSLSFKSKSSSSSTIVNHYKATHLLLSASSSSHCSSSSLSLSNSYIFIDVENVRGKTGFTLSHYDLLSRIVSWMSYQQQQQQTTSPFITGRISLIMDHGSLPSAYHLSDIGISIIFSGDDGTKADDVIVRDVTMLNSFMGDDDGDNGGGELVVITSDGELINRCRHAMTQSQMKKMQEEKRGSGHVVSLRIWEPVSFLSVLDRAVEERGIVMTFDETQQQKKEEEKDVEQETAVNDDSEALLKRMEMEIDVTNRLLALEKQLTFTNNNNNKRRNSSVSNKKRKKLLKRADTLRHRLASLGPSTLHRVVAVNTNNSGIDRREQNELLKRWDVRLEQHRRRRSSIAGVRERTGDRILLAENFRRYLERRGRQEQLETRGKDDDDDDDESNCNNSKEPHHQSAEGVLLSQSLAERHAHYVNSLLTTTTSPPPSSSSSSTRLRLVIISDTHGYESSLSSLPHHHLSSTTTTPSSPPSFPTGDVLIHCGDFSSDSNKQSSLHRFDSWIASLTTTTSSFRRIFVLRGNHDPMRSPFLVGGDVTYITEDYVEIINGVTLKFHPYKRHRHHHHDDDDADVWISHEPPLGVLDWCYNGERAGNGVLTDRLIRLAKGHRANVPKVWLCGHIHESRGVEIVDFSRLDSGIRHGRHRRRSRIIKDTNDDDDNDSTKTVVINACNANGGKAERLVHGPMVLDLECDKLTNVITPRLSSSLSTTSNGNDASNNYTHETIIPSSSSDHDDDDGHGDAVDRLLLAVDVGLTMGASLFDERGRLLRYEQFRWNDEKELREAVPRIVTEWENGRYDFDDDDKDIDGDDDSSTTTTATEQEKKKWAITHIAVEGGGSLSHIWEHYASSSSIQLLKVNPFEWRHALLTKKERQSGRSSKEASRLVARQIVYHRGYYNHRNHRYNNNNNDDDDGAVTMTRQKHVGSFPTDVAESVVMGLYVISERLSWVTSEGGGGLVKRYTNGDVILPK